MSKPTHENIVEFKVYGEECVIFRCFDSNRNGKNTAIRYQLTKH